MRVSQVPTFSSDQDITPRVHISLPFHLRPVGAPSFVRPKIVSTLSAGTFSSQRLHPSSTSFVVAVVVVVVVPHRLPPPPAAAAAKPQDPLFKPPGSSHSRPSTEARLSFLPCNLPSDRQTSIGQRRTAPATQTNPLRLPTSPTASPRSQPRGTDFALVYAADNEPRLCCASTQIAA
ncbi:hypothetical protein CGMCC3_g9278 [Colletotrichum fructicola]|nr:uncharacterized protein CGMCC3_g9278 [Colletotrichum fructicola]KAE9574682.1 hypothetical protein CGMCC3_g9278 [Colletotrichum fructicola]